MIDSLSARQSILKFLAFVLISLALWGLDRPKENNTQSPMKPVRELISTALYPIQKTIDFPFSLYRYVKNYFTSHYELAEQNKELRQLVQVYAAREQKYRIIQDENARLRKLLQTDAIETERFKLANILTVDSNRFRQTVIVDKGSNDGVYEGQVAITGNSVYGQVISTSPNTSVIMQLTDPKHTIPVKNTRTGTMALAVGTGESNALILTKTESTNDVHVGDVLVTSGLGQVFPPGFTVATVEKVTYNPSDSFTTVRTKTVTHFSKTSEVLLIWRGEGDGLNNQSNENEANH